MDNRLPWDITATAVLGMLLAITILATAGRMDPPGHDTAHSRVLDRGATV